MHSYEHFLVASSFTAYYNIKQKLPKLLACHETARANLVKK